MIEIINAIIEKLGVVLQAVLSLLPSSPFNFVANIDNQWLKAINWLFPVSEAIAHLELYVLAVISYYAIRIVLRWIKAVGS